jgi:hypothetical protein
VADGLENALGDASSKSPQISTILLTPLRKLTKPGNTAYVAAAQAGCDIYRIKTSLYNAGTSGLLWPARSSSHHVEAPRQIRGANALIRRLSETRIIHSQDCRSIRPGAGTIFPIMPVAMLPARGAPQPEGLVAGGVLKIVVPA